MRSQRRKGKRKSETREERDKKRNCGEGLKNGKKIK